WIFFAVQSAGFGVSAMAAAPFPFPSGPWQVTQFVAATRLPCSTDLAPAGSGFFFAFSPSRAVPAPRAQAAAAAPITATAAPAATSPRIHLLIAAPISDLPSRPRRA